jgi:hypothetical protein
VIASGFGNFVDLHQQLQKRRGVMILHCVIDAYLALTGESVPMAQ